MKACHVSEDGQPDNAAVVFEFDGPCFYVGGVKPKNSPKYKNLLGGQKKVALLIDDMVSIKPWKLKGIRIYGTADLVERDGQFGPGMTMRSMPDVSWSSDLVGPAFIDGKYKPSKIVHTNE